MVDPFGFFVGGFICIIILVVGILLFILLVAWLIGGSSKKTEVHYIPQQPVQPQMKSNVKYCNKCGRSIPFDSQFCSYCGNKF
jgi:hypothetical protein